MRSWVNICSASHRPYVTTGLVLSLETPSLALVMSKLLSQSPEVQKDKRMKRPLDLHAILLQSLVLHLVAALGSQNNENCQVTSKSLKNVEVHFGRSKLCRFPSRNLSHQNLTHAHKIAECTWFMILKIGN